MICSKNSKEISYPLIKRNLGVRMYLLLEELTSKSQFRKPIRDPFSDESDDSDLGQGNYQSTGTPFPPKPPQQKSVLQQLQGSIKWDKNEQI